MVPALKPRIDPVTGEEVLRQVEVWLPEKKVRAWNPRWASALCPTYVEGQTLRLRI